MICQVCLEDVSTGSGIFFGVCAKVFLESKVGEPLLKASHTPSDHIAQLLHSHTVSAGRGALLLSVKRIYSFKHPQTDELVCLSFTSPHKPPLILPATTVQRPSGQIRTTKAPACILTGPVQYI